MERAKTPDDLSVRQVARILEVSPMTVHRYFNLGKLKGYRTSRAKTAPKKIYRSSVREFAKREQGRDVTL